ncbi:piggyBac transposable element-derived protein 4-like [Aricia agestis]|uniref:piggyBac transposable element-derived protein 4-like n=1 Tax=Aricia agestis TaxID=91739 RepID=UPI001C202D66|nr:piggyBac transposable element-derived protein 4-like [Aricia agestis]XP_041986055.1 piggyBac transposable element-derived protein 4-like [Aricia agestis]XP_041986056.1 piggyBac transposable element-derived protein 4-like [Aricia agestis]
MESLDSKEKIGSHVEEKSCEGLETPIHPKRKRVRQPARVVQKTSGGSLLTGAFVACKKPPSGHIRVLKPSELLCANVVERVEAMDPLKVEVEVMEACPDLPQVGEAVPRGGGKAEECSSTDVPEPSAFAEVAADNASGIISICAANITNFEGSPNATSDDVLPSTSGMKETCKRSAKRRVREGSEVDSEHDDEFEESLVDVANLATLDRNIPNDDELEEPVREIIGAMESVMDAEADCLPGVSTSYDWKEDFDSFTGVPESFSGPTPGPVKDYDTAYDAFTDIWSKDIIDRIVLATNRYAKQKIDKMKAEGTLKPSSRLHKWTDTNADEIMVLFAVFMYMAIDPRTNQYEYWKSDDYLEMPKFRKLMPYSRYILLSTFLYFVDNSDVSQNSLPNEEIWLSPKLAKLQPVISHLKYKFASLYNLDRFISIDESLTLFKGRLAWVQTIRTKAARFGIKSYELCESRTGYMHDFEIYTGKNSDRDDTADADVAPSVDLAGKSTKIVLHLLKVLKNQGHCVTMDNFYNCPALARYLKSLGFDCLGTLRPNRRNVPSDVAKMSNNVAKGTIIARHCGDVTVLGWKDSKVVTMISTYHTDETFVGSKKGKMQVKPKCVGDYNRTMGGVDLKDQKLAMYLLERKRGVKWYTKMFKRLLNTSIHNALIMLVMSSTRRNKLPMSQREFRYNLAKSLVDRHRPGLTVTSPQVKKNNTEIRLRRDIVHEPMYCTGRNNRKRCKVCYRQGVDKMVHSQCVTCGEYLCFEKCWKDWHSLINLKSKVSGRKRRH